MMIDVVAVVVDVVDVVVKNQCHHKEGFNDVTNTHKLFFLVNVVIFVVVLAVVDVDEVVEVVDVVDVEDPVSPQRSLVYRRTKTGEVEGSRSC